jgi:hypothetical protein
MRQLKGQGSKEPPWAPGEELCHLWASPNLVLTPPSQSMLSLEGAAQLWPLLSLHSGASESSSVSSPGKWVQKPLLLLLFGSSEVMQERTLKSLEC